MQASTAHTRTQVNLWSHLLKYRAVVLVSPDEDLGDRPERLHEEAAVALRDGLVLAQHAVQVPGTKRKQHNCILTREGNLRRPDMTDGGRPLAGQECGPEMMRP